MKTNIFILLILLQINGLIFGQFAPAANQIGTTAIHKDSSIIINWANQVIAFARGPEDISNPNSILASFGDSTNALFTAQGNSIDVVSLGDGGTITLSFPYPIQNANGPDFTIFENSFDHQYLEFAFVEVSSNGQDFVRFPATSNIDNTSQTGPFGYSDATKINNLAGKYKQGYGTPFDLSDLPVNSSLNLDSIVYVKIIDVVGSIDSNFGTLDQYGDLVNDPFPTAFSSCGFDLDAVGVIHQNNPLNVSAQELISFKLYPNPVTNYVFIETELENMAYKVNDLQGKQVLSGYIQDNNYIDLSELTNGYYLFTLVSDEFLKTKKIVVKK
ncbi:T9SS C-terminal target domain-containing protein [Putridiphycobacter roseus]|uniref:T9SS C-terminal target domain-containing protein n=1 Tax=Putridiphycobacter roseus TaxID=2219161 RepID=A0A2W1NRY4_9FLAO|nr:T9SS type A sorting domain-containing protein [Putridiphycobacter roseus]PZE18402.1 T9SS C-terminal target domain-containing protein [Putridiphycobacter roseus]